ncbi:MAG TPA: ABC transporter permease, partial [Spirochaetota bacterium]|nr:ABC transporter permease [Spirochaetota bacterium]
NMATLGLVSLPGMMTGQILGGSEPTVAIKYQIIIMIAIFSSTSISALLSLKFLKRAIIDKNDLIIDKI